MADVAIQIEKGFALPARGTPSKYPLGQMEIGDSFFADSDKVVAAVHTFGRRHGKKFTTRAVDGGFRVWRIA